MLCAGTKPAVCLLFNFFLGPNKLARKACCLLYSAARFIQIPRSHFLMGNFRVRNNQDSFNAVLVQTRISMTCVPVSCRSGLYRAGQACIVQVRPVSCRSGLYRAGQACIALLTGSTPILAAVGLCTTSRIVIQIIVRRLCVYICVCKHLTLN